MSQFATGSAALRERLAAKSNDFSQLELIYEQLAGEELIDRFVEVDGARHFEPEVTVSVVIPTYNSRSTLRACLSALARCSFNERHGTRIEVLVVDDGSTDGTWELLKGLSLPLSLRCVRQQNRGRAAARNIGIALAKGDVLVFCDADMIVGAFAIEELAKRHQYLRNVLLVGFRCEVNETDVIIQGDDGESQLEAKDVPFWLDERITSPAPGVPHNLCVESGHFRYFGGRRWMLTPDGDRVDLTVQAYTALLSIERSEALALDGFSEDFRGWGYEDTHFAARACAEGSFIIPVYSAAGWHVSHPPKSADKWREYALNGQTYRCYLESELPRPTGQRLQTATRRIEASLERSGSTREQGFRTGARRRAFVDPLMRGLALSGVGRYPEAAQAFGASIGSRRDTAARMLMGRALRQSADLAAAREAFTLAAEATPSACVECELAVTLLALDEVDEARACLRRAQEADPQDGYVTFLSAPPFYSHRARARFNDAQGWHELAEWHRRAALLHEEASKRGRGLPPPELRAGAAEQDAIARALSAPGWLTRLQAELIVESVRAWLSSGKSTASILDVRSFCGQSALLLWFAFALSGARVQLVSIDDPELRSPIPGQAPREVFDTQLLLNEAGPVSRLPEQAAKVSLEMFDVVFVNANLDPDGEARARHHASFVAPGGLLMLHGQESFSAASDEFAFSAREANLMVLHRAFGRIEPEFKAS